MKTRSAVTKRFKATASGKLMRGHPSMGHLLTKKSSKRKRALKRDATVAKGHAKTYKKIMYIK